MRSMEDLSMRKLLEMTADPTKALVISRNQESNTYTVEIGHFSSGDWVVENSATDIFLVDAILDLEIVLRGD